MTFDGESIGTYYRGVAGREQRRAFLDDPHCEHIIRKTPLLAGWQNYPQACSKFFCDVITMEKHASSNACKLLFLFCFLF